MLKSVSVLVATLKEAKTNSVAKGQWCVCVVIHEGSQCMAQVLLLKWAGSHMMWCSSL